MSAQFADRQSGTPDSAQAASEMGLATGAYLSTRGKEECYRAKRYGRALALMVVGLAQPDLAGERRMQVWLRSQTRTSDIPAYLGESTYALLLPECDQQAAAGLEARLRVDFPHARVGISSYGEDCEVWEDMLDFACRGVGRQAGN